MHSRRQGHAELAQLMQRADAAMNTDRILLLEDEITLRDSLCRMLRTQLGFETHATGSLEEGLELVESLSPALVLTDLELPDGSGLQLLDSPSIQSKQTPILFITGELERFAADIPEARRLDVLSKPLDLSDLGGRIEKKLRLRLSNPPPKSAFTVADYLQLAGMARRSVMVGISSPSGASGKIFVEEGRPVWAEDDEGSGPEAFARLAVLVGADIACKPCSEWPAEPNLNQSLESMLLEAVRVSDERAHKSAPSGRSPAPPSAAKRPGPPRPAPRAQATGASSSEEAIPPTDRHPGNAALEVKPTGANPQTSTSADPRGIQAQAPAAETTSPPPSPAQPASAQRRPRQALTTPPRPGHGLGVPQAPFNARGVPSGAAPRSTRRAPSLEELSAACPSLLGFTRADRHGSVVAMTGELDAETTCAVATLARQNTAAMAAELGLGEVRSWQISMGESTWYVVEEADGMVIARGEVTKNPSAILNKLNKLLLHKP